MWWVIAASCQPEEPGTSVGTPNGLVWSVADGAFSGLDTPPNDPFDVLTQDADGDGDLDVLLHPHHLAPLEVWLGDGAGSFTPMLQPEAGLWDNPAVADLFGSLAAMETAVDADGRPGLFVWHDMERARGAWRFRLLAASPVEAPLHLVVRADSPIMGVTGLDSTEIDGPFGGFLTVDLARGGEHRSFALDLHDTGVEMVLDADVAGAPVPLRAGVSLAEVGLGTASLWMNDPHGLAWADVVGGPAPELFATRGALRGTLLPPDGPKTDGWWVGDGDPTLYTPAPGVVPPGYNRGRQVAWVDVDGDGVSELHIGCEKTPNQLLVWHGDVLVDEAPARGLDTLAGDSSTWFDVDRDGDEDVVWLDGHHVWLGRNDGGHFTHEDGDDLGLVYPARSLDFVDDGLFDDDALVPDDVDGDGDLDLWFTGHGNDAVALYEADAGRFTDRTDERGLAGVTGARRLLPTDVNNDGRRDAVAIGPTVQALVRTTAGRYTAVLMSGELDPSAEATLTDANGDGWVDVVRYGSSLGRKLLLAMPPVGAETVVLRPGASPTPVGSLVTATLASGRTSTVRFGSHANSWVSQSLTPLHWSWTDDDPVIELTWVWPDGVVSELAVEPGEQVVSR